MADNELDFGEAPRTVNVPNNHFHDFCAACVRKNIGIPWFAPHRNYYRVNMTKPLPDDLKHLTFPDPE